LSIDQLSAAPQPTYGILAYYNSDVRVWSVEIRDVQIGIGVVGCSDVRIANVFLKYTGDPYNGLPDPAIWVTSSDDVTIRHGESRNTGVGPGGDGEVSVSNSSSVEILYMHSVDCGASAFYLVNCDSCKVEGTEVHRAEEWGIDVVNGSDNVTVRNNVVKWCRYGGSVFHENNSAGGTFTGNYFQDNNWSGVANCNAINVKGDPSKMTIQNNQAIPPPEYCIWP
jgi:hypothetical protein